MNPRKRGTEEGVIEIDVFPLVQVCLGSTSSVNSGPSEMTSTSVKNIARKSRYQHLSTNRKISTSRQQSLRVRTNKQRKALIVPTARLLEGACRQYLVVQQ